jgi:hypothetical protein
MNSLVTERVKIIKGLSPSADVYNTSPETDRVNMKGYKRACFLLHQKTSTSNLGVATIKAYASTAASAGTSTQIKFTYRKMTTGVSEAISAPSVVTATTGQDTVANEDTVHVVEIEAADCPQTSPYVSLVLTEKVNDPVIGSCLILLADPSYADVDPGVDALT